MKPTLRIISIFPLFFIACTKEKPYSQFVETPIQKSVEFRVFAGNDYSAPLFQNVKVDLRLQIVKTNYATGLQTTLWDSTFSTRKLTDFPQRNNQLVLKKIYPIFELQEKITGAFSVKYDTDGQIQQAASFEDAGKGQASLIFDAGM